MKIGILGSGIVGQSLAAGFLQHGHDVMLGTRDVAKPEVQAWLAAAGPHAQAGTFAQTAEFAELAVLATLWSGTEAALSAAGAGNLRGKIVIDATNPLRVGEDGVPSLALGSSDSGGEQVQRWLPGANVVKAFNIISAYAMVHPQFPGGPPTMFIAGDDEAARGAVSKICTTFGWEVIDIGNLRGARLLEPLAMLWITHGFRSGTWDHAFKLLTASGGI